jgi:5-enolpyruvylshikimate-3-phosphate synthase
LRADKETVIDGAEAVNKSYPDFWKDMVSLNTILHKQDQSN